MFIFGLQFVWYLKSFEKKAGKHSQHSMRVSNGSGHRCTELFKCGSFLHLDFLLFEKPLSAKVWTEKFSEAEFKVNFVSSIKHLDVTFTFWIVC